MKNFGKLLGALALLAGFVGMAQAAAQVCTNTDYFCYESGPSGSLITPARLDASGNMYLLGILNPQVKTIQGTIGTGISNATTGTTTATAIPVLVSSNVSQGMAIVATTNLVSGFVNGIQSTTSGATSVLGVADVSASSATVLNVDYTGVALALTSGTVTVGDLLVSTVTWPGYLVSNNSAAAGAIVGTALATNASTYNGLTRVLLKH